MNKREWKAHKYIAKIVSKTGKIRYIYEKNKNSDKSHDTTLDRNYTEEKWTKNDRRRVENETGRDMSKTAAKENAELDRKAKLTRGERRFQEKDSKNKSSKSLNRDRTLDLDYNSEKVSKEDIRQWNAQNAKNGFKDHKFYTETQRKKKNAEEDRRNKLTRDERKLQHSYLTGMYLTAESVLFHGDILISEL